MVFAWVQTKKPKIRVSAPHRVPWLSQRVAFLEMGPAISETEMLPSLSPFWRLLVSIKS